MTRPGFVTWCGLAVVGTSAAVLTATTLRALALACGFNHYLSWLLPVSIDAAGAVATGVWLTGRAHPDAVRFARQLAWTAVIVSVLGNAAQHGLDAYGTPMPWWGVVAVSALPPAAFGATVHLAVLVGRAMDGINESTSVPSDTSEPAPAVTAAEPELPDAIAQREPVVEAKPRAKTPAERQRDKRARERVAAKAAQGAERINGVEDPVGVTA